MVYSPKKTSSNSSNLIPLFQFVYNFVIHEWWDNDNFPGKNISHGLLITSSLVNLHLIF